MAKSYTDIKQSAQLALLLPVESADMYYQYVLPKSDKIKHIPENGSPKEALEWYNKGYTHFGKELLSLKEYCIPCWSLAALIEQIPSDLYGAALTIEKDDSELLKYGLNYHDRWGREDDIQTKYYDNLVDACVEMIIKLHKQKFL